MIPISCRMRSSGKKIGKEGHTREIRQPLVLIRFALNLNKENSIVATRERGFESLRPDLNASEPPFRILTQLGTAPFLALSS